MRENATWRARWVLVTLVVGLLGLALAGCSAGSEEAGSTSAGSDAAVSPDEPSSDGSGISVPDVVGSDGADALSEIEDAGLTTSLADGTGEDAEFDPSRDPAGCEVTDQNPVGGEGAGEGDEVELQLDCRQIDWENQEGSDWEAYNDAYDSAFDDGCDGLFAQSPDGSLYEDDTEYTATDCQSLNPGDGSDDAELPSDVPDDPGATGTELGETAGCRALFDQQGVVSLNYGTDSYTAEDCPEGSVASSSSGPSNTGRPSRAGSGRRLKSDYYRVSQAIWAAYSPATKLKAARYFLANNPRDCGGSGVTPDGLVGVVDAGGLGDSPATTRVNELMIAVCKAPGE